MKAGDTMTESEAIKICNTIGFATSFSNPKWIPLNTTKEELAEAMRMAIQSLEKQIPKKPYNDNENGIYEKEYCPICHRSLFPNDHHCICGQAIDWSDEE